MSEMHIERSTAPVRRQVEDAIRSAIVDGRFAPGQRLVESRLCESLGVSRPIVREALRQVVAEGLAEIIPNRGTRVASISAEEARQIYEVRVQLEALAGRGFVKHAEDSAVSDLRAVLEELEQAAAGEACGRSVLAIKQRFYAILLTHCGNKIVRETLERLNNRISQLRALSLSRRGRLRQTVVEMREILKAIESRDPEATYKACGRHVRQAAENALQALEGQDYQAITETSDRED